LLHGCFGGGGGYGDPLERDPQRVCLDVINGLVSRKWADRSYGTILTDDLQVDQKATERRRGEIREARLEAAKFNGENLSIQFPEDAPVYNLSEELRAIRGGNGKTYIQCTKSGFVLCPIDQNWKDHCALSRAPLSDAGPRRSNSGRFEMRLFMCPKTAQLLDVEVALPDDPPLYDEIQIKL
jgi:N-methylhydantoinase B